MKLRWSGDDYASWNKALSAQLTTLLGLDRLFQQARPELNIRRLWKKEHELGTIEKLIYTAEPGIDIPAYLCIPNHWQTRGPIFICLQGHSSGMHNSIAVKFGEEDTPIEIKGDRDFGLGCMRRGIAALCVEQRAFGEREDTERTESWASRCHNPTLRALMLGRTLLGERVYDVDRSIDLLMELGGFDTNRLGVMGNSGGGTVALLSGALLDRITHVMPCCSFCSFAESIMAIDHCECNYIPGILDWAECAEIGGLVAPKPLVVINGKDDPIFPLEACKKEFARLQTIYNAAGAPNQCRHVIGDGAHRFYAKDAWAAMMPYLN